MTENSTATPGTLSKMLSRSTSIFGGMIKDSADTKPNNSDFMRTPSSRSFNAGSNSPPRSGLARGTSVASSFGPLGETPSIASAFEFPLPYNKGEYDRLLNSAEPSVEALKECLDKTICAVDVLREKCVGIESMYQSAIQQAAHRYQSSVSELFTMDQKLHSEDSTESLQGKLRAMKERAVKIDKERRAVQAKLEDSEKLNHKQAAELAELRQLVGGSIEEIRLQAVDAKMTRTLFAELGNEKAKVERLQLELNHDRNHFAEMSAVFEEKMNTFKDRMAVLEVQHTEMSRELKKAERESSSNHEEMVSYKTALSHTNDRMRQLLETTVTKMEYDEEVQRRQVAEMKAESESTLRKSLQKQLEQAHLKFLNHIEELKSEVVSANTHASTVLSEKETYESMLRVQEDEQKRLLEELDRMSRKIDVLTAERKTSIQQYIERIESQDVKYSELSEKYDNDIYRLTKSIAELDTLTARYENDIAQLHSTVDELKGNIRVFARIRPLLPEEVSRGQSAPAVVPLSGGYSLRLGRYGTHPAMLDTMKPDDPENTRSFSYDKVFPPEIAQSAVFEQVSEYVKSTMEGHATCLLSYGQTGSGKTYSMQGPSVDPNNEARGIIPRAMEEIVKQIQEGRSQGWVYEVKVSFIEIYMENIQDLLRDKAEDVKHEIKKQDGAVFVTDVTTLPLDPSDTSQITNIMSKAARMRNVASTNQNSESSRSHAIFTLYIHGENADAGQELDGTMYLVDLAGSERLSKSQSTGETLKETQFINKSLSALGDVFLAIANKSAHVPYRNSKLTYLLQSALSGFHKTLMIVHLSPTEDSYGESLCTMRFASQVNSATATSSLRSIGDGSSSSTPSRSPSFTSSRPSGGMLSKSPRNSFSSQAARRPSGDISSPPLGNSPKAKRLSGGRLSSTQQEEPKSPSVSMLKAFAISKEAYDKDLADLSFDGSKNDTSPPASPKRPTHALSPLSLGSKTPERPVAEVSSQYSSADKPVDVETLTFPLETPEMVDEEKPFNLETLRVGDVIEQPLSPNFEQVKVDGIAVLKSESPVPKSSDNNEEEASVSLADPLWDTIVDSKSLRNSTGSTGSAKSPISRKPPTGLPRSGSLIEAKKIPRSSYATVNNAASTSPSAKVSKTLSTKGATSNSSSSKSSGTRGALGKGF